MNTLIKEIFKNKEAAALPGLLESGGLPALVSGLSAVHRANLAAALRLKSGRPIFVICPDDTAAESFARDLASMLGEETETLVMRDYTFYAAWPCRASTRPTSSWPCAPPARRSSAASPRCTRFQRAARRS